MDGHEIVETLHFFYFSYLVIVELQPCQPVCGMHCASVSG